jgi:hypothetical protein
MLNIIMQNIIMLNDIILNVIMLNVIMLIVVLQSGQCYNVESHYTDCHAECTLF